MGIPHSNGFDPRPQAHADNRPVRFHFLASKFTTLWHQVIDHPEWNLEKADDCKHQPYQHSLKCSAVIIEEKKIPTIDQTPAHPGIQTPATEVDGLQVRKIVDFPTCFFHAQLQVGFIRIDEILLIHKSDAEERFSSK